MQNQSNQASVIMPSQDALETKHIIESSILQPGISYHIFDHVEYPDQGGIYTYYKGLPYPKKGFPFPEAIYNNDVMKRVTMTLLKTIGTKYMVIPLATIALLPWFAKAKILDNFLGQYIRIGDWLLKSSFLKPERYSNPCRSLWKLVENFLLNLGIEKSTAWTFGKIIATLIEYDDAYRYRLEDIMSESSKTAWSERPIYEFRRLVKIFAERETYDQVKHTLKALSIVGTAVLLHPKIRKAFILAMESLTPKEFNMLTLDDADRYHVLRRMDYNFTGRTFEERKKIYADVHRRSKCCEAKVELTINKDDPEMCDSAKCLKCGNECIFGFIFPPEMTIAPGGVVK